MSDFPSVALVVIDEEGNERPGWALRAGDFIERTDYDHGRRVLKVHARSKRQSVPLWLRSAVTADLHIDQLVHEPATDTWRIYCREGEAPWEWREIPRDAALEIRTMFMKGIDEIADYLHREEALD